MGTWGSLVCPLWASLLSSIPQRTGMFTVHLYEWQTQGGKAFLQASASKITGRVERRETQVRNPSSSRSLILMMQALC